MSPCCLWSALDTPRVRMFRWRAMLRLAVAGAHGAGILHPGPAPPVSIPTPSPETITEQQQLGCRTWYCHKRSPGRALYVSSGLKTSFCSVWKQIPANTGEHDKINDKLCSM